MSLRNKKQNSKKSPRPPHNISNESSTSRPGLPDDVKTKLGEVFGMIEKEFETLYIENTALRERVDALSERLDMLTSEQRSQNLEMTHPPYNHASTSSVTSTALLNTPDHSITPLRKKKTSGTNITKKLLPGPKKSSSNVKANPPDCSYGCTYYGHKDGIWDISQTKNVIGTASADNSATIWDANSGQVYLKYTGHTGSVNSIAFHPSDQLVATASGDGSTHLWKYFTALTEKQSGRDSSGEDKLSADEEDGQQSSAADNATVKVPILSLQEHTGPVMSCDWLCNGDQLVTASWDHLALLWDAHTGTRVHSLTGHDDELTHVSTHPTQKLLVTSSQDTTFRLWDFRAPLIHSVNVFQGHSKGVTSAVFSLKENVISASDDNTVKIWDLHKMRYPIASIRLDCGVNRISVSHDHHVLALPLDNGQIRLYDLGGNRLTTLPNRNRKGHVRMVHSVCWSSDKHLASSSPGKCNFFSAGFDARIVGWKIQF